MMNVILMKIDTGSESSRAGSRSGGKRTKCAIVGMVDGRFFSPLLVVTCRVGGRGFKTSDARRFELLRGIVRLLQSVNDTCIKRVRRHDQYPS